MIVVVTVTTAAVMLLGVMRHMWSAEIDGDCYRILVDYFSFDVDLIDYCDGILALF